MKNIIDHNANLPSEYLLTADQVTVTLNDHPLRVLRYQQLDEPCYMVHVSLTNLSAPAEIKIGIKRKYTECTVLSTAGPYPFTYGGKRNKDIILEIADHEYLCLDCDGLGYLFLVFDPVQPVPSGEGVLTAEACGIVSQSDEVQTEAIQASIDRVAESDKLHTLVFPAGYYRSGDIEVRGGVHMYLASGAVLQASDSADDMGDPSIPGFHRDRACFIHANRQKNIAITGHGHIDGNRAVLDNQKYFKGMVLITACEQVKVQGPIFSDACGWNLTPRHCRDVAIDRVKIINNRPRISCINTDGCNPDGCQNVCITRCLMHTGDDAVAVKTSDYGGESKNCVDIKVQDLLAVNNSATAKVGTETMGSIMENIHFERVCAVRTCRLVAVDAYDQAKIRQVIWKQCYAHRFVHEIAESYLIDLQAPPQGQAFRKILAQATVTGVYLSDIQSREDSKARLWTRLDDGVPAVNHVTTENICMGDQPCELEIIEIDHEKHSC